MTGSGLKLQQERFRLDIKEKIFTEEWSGFGTGFTGKWWNHICSKCSKICVWGSWGLVLVVGLAVFR